jgi:DNA-binding GntR family transcriptional regulator
VRDTPLAVSTHTRSESAAPASGRAISRTTLAVMASAKTKADEIAGVLEEAILSGELAPNELLRQEQLSEEFGVSRTPIREALRQLAALGLVSLIANRGARVRSLSPEDLREVFVVRAALESFAADMARTRMTKAELRELRKAEKRFADLTHVLRDRQGGKDDVRSIASEWVRANDAFHDVFLSAAGTKLLADTARSVRRVFPGQTLWWTADLDELYAANLAQHRAIVEAFEARSPDVRALVEQHIFESGQLLERALAEAQSARSAFRQRVSWADSPAAKG